MRTSLVLICGLLAGSSFSILTAQTVCDSADHTIMAGSNYFNPGSLTLNAGETVAWINEGGFHDVNGIASAITGDPFGNPESFSLPPVQGNSMGVCMGVHTFTVPGTYDYDCSIGTHAADGMVATLTVEAPAVERNDAAGLLAAMLEGVHGEECLLRGILDATDTHNAAHVRPPTLTERP